MRPGTLPPQRMTPVRQPDPESVAGWSPAELVILARVEQTAAKPRGRGNPYATSEERDQARLATWRRYYAAHREEQKARMRRCRQAARERGNA